VLIQVPPSLLRPRHEEARLRLLDQGALLGRQVAVHDERIDGGKLTEKRQRLPADLGMVGDHHDLVGAAHHLPFRLH
jgi:hypothetical protein